jgi:hypothetical protein
MQSFSLALLTATTGMGIKLADETKQVSCQPQHTMASFNHR